MSHVSCLMSHVSCLMHHVPVGARRRLVPDLLEGAVGEYAALVRLCRHTLQHLPTSSVSCNPLSAQTLAPTLASTSRPVSHQPHLSKERIELDLGGRQGLGAARADPRGVLARKFEERTEIETLVPEGEARGGRAEKEIQVGQRERDRGARR